MASIIKRKRGDGTFAYRADVRIKQKGKIVFQEAKTFDQRKLAEAWAKQREIALQQPGALAAAQARKSVGDLIGWYIETFGENFGRTKLSHLQLLQKMTIASKGAALLSARDIIEHVQERRKEGAGPSTVNNDLIWLRTVYKAARPALEIDLNMQVVADAVAFCREQRLIGKSRQRSRRPTQDELERLNKHFLSRDGRAQLPMVDIMWFALHSTRREEELTQLLWADNNEADMTGIVRDAKHPTAKAGNHRIFKYTPEAWEIAQRQPRVSAKIFPYKGRSIGAAFTRACKLLEIRDLRFHDLRHEGASRLFEKGYSITEVQQFTLHESWATLQRYVQLKPGDVKHR